MATEMLNRLSPMHTNQDSLSAIRHLGIIRVTGTDPGGGEGVVTFSHVQPHKKKNNSSYLQNIGRPCYICLIYSLNMLQNAPF